MTGKEWRIGGTIWDTVFRVRQNGDAVEMNMQMDALPHNIPARIMTPMILSVVSRFVGQDMDSIKEYCENAEPLVTGLQVDSS